MNTSQLDRALEFKRLHESASGFLIANPWDIGSARLLALSGFKALASTSAGFCFSRGVPDFSTTRNPLLNHLAELASATDLPLSADLEDGFGASPEDVAETVQLAAAAGVVGASVEDHCGVAGAPLTELPQAVDRVRAAVDSTRRLPFPFLVTARAENFLLPNPDLAATIKRLQYYQEAGADVLFAPGMTDLQHIATLVRSVDRPVNVLISVPGMAATVQQLFDVGVRRISVGGSFARAAYGELLRAAAELQSAGTLDYADKAISGSALNGMLGGWRQ